MSSGPQAAVFNPIGAVAHQNALIPPHSVVVSRLVDGELVDFIFGPPTVQRMVVPSPPVEVPVPFFVPGPVHTVVEQVPGAVRFRDEVVEVPGRVHERIEVVETPGPVVERTVRIVEEPAPRVREVVVETPAPISERVVCEHVPGPVIRRQIRVPASSPRPVTTTTDSEVVVPVYVPVPVVTQVPVPILVPNPMMRAVLIRQIGPMSRELERLRAEYFALTGVRLPDPLATHGVPRFLFAVESDGTVKFKRRSERSKASSRK